MFNSLKRLNNILEYIFLRVFGYIGGEVVLALGFLSYAIFAFQSEKVSDWFTYISIAMVILQMSVIYIKIKFKKEKELLKNS